MKKGILLVFLIIMILSSSSLAQETCSNSRLSTLTVGEMGRVVAGVTGVRIRDEPNTTSTEITRISEGDLFTVVDGPLCHDDYVWWQVDYHSTQGWVAEGDLETVWLEARFDPARIRLPSSKLRVTSDNRLLDFRSTYDSDEREVYGYYACPLPDCDEFRWTPLIKNEEPGPATIYWTATLDADGNPVVALIRHSPLSLYLVRCHDPLCVETTTTTVYDIYSPGHHGANINLELALTTQGNPVIAFVEYLLPPGVGRLQFSCEPDTCTIVLRLAICEDPICRSVRVIDMERHDFAQEYDHYFRMVVTADDRPIVGYLVSVVDNITNFNDLFLASCDTPLCDGLTTTHIDQSAFRLSLGINSEGFPVLIYNQWVDDQIAIRTAICTDVDCSTLVISTPIQQSGSVPETPLLFTPDGYPVIAYAITQGRDAQLHLTVCRDPICTGWNTKALDPQPGDIVRLMSTQDALFNPILRYPYRSFDDERLLLCDDPTCETYHTNPIVFLPATDSGG